MIRTARVYTHPPKSDGYRILVDRLWPRGIRKDEVDLWLKEVAPSNELRKWYEHDPEKWSEFKKRYTLELRERPDEVKQVMDLAEGGDVVLLYASKEEKINNAEALKLFLERKAGKGSR